MPRVLRGVGSATGETPVLDGLGDMRRTDFVAAGEIGDGAGDLQDAVVCSGGEALFIHRAFEKRFALSVEGAMFADLCRRHL